MDVGAVPLVGVPRLLVGRDGELAALRELVVALGAGVGGAALVVGGGGGWEPWLVAGCGGGGLVVGGGGSGKSSLVAALLEELRDVRLVWVSGDELGQGFPLL